MNELIRRAELFMVVRDYKNEEIQRWNEGVDITALHSKSEDKIFLRVITKPKSKSGIIGIDAVNEMRKVMNRENYKKGILVGNKFSKAAREEMRREGIQMISDKFMPQFKPFRVYLAIRDYTDNLCEAKCGQIPQKVSDCKGYSKGKYTCKIRLISDNASLHFERGWTTLLQDDLIQLLAIDSSISNQYFKRSKV